MRCRNMRRGGDEAAHDGSSPARRGYSTPEPMKSSGCSSGTVCSPRWLARSRPRGGTCSNKCSAARTWPKMVCSAASGGLQSRRILAPAFCRLCRPTDRLIVWRQLPRREAALVLVEAQSDVRTLDSRRDRAPRRWTARSPSWMPTTSRLSAIATGCRRWRHQRRWSRASGLDCGTRASPDDSVKPLMTRDVVDVREDQTVADAIAALRKRRRAARTRPIGCFVVDARHLLRGTRPAADAGAGRNLATPVSLRSMLTNVAAFTPDRAGDRCRHRRSSGTTSCRRRSSTIAASSSDG